MLLFYLVQYEKINREYPENETKERRNEIKRVKNTVLVGKKTTDKVIKDH